MSAREKKCQLCETTQHLIDTWMEEFNHIHEKLQAVTNSEGEYSKWLKWMCMGCKDQLDELWKFKIRCKNAYRTFLDEMDGISGDCGLTFYILEDEKNVEDTCMETIEKIEKEEETAYYERFEEVFLPDRINEKNKDAKETSLESTAQPIKKIDRRLKEYRTDRAAKKSKIESFICSHCDKKFKSKGSLRRHINVTHLKLLHFLCRICGRKCSSIPKLTQHEETHEENRPRIPCKMCDKTFTQERNLKRHMDIHLEPSKRRIKPCICKHCGKTFIGRDALVQHLKEFSGSQKAMYPCSYCAKEFKTHQRLQHHERVHTGEKPFTCEICSKSFKQLAHLQRHLKMHAGERNYPCNFCDKVFTTNGNRTVHMRIHTGEMPYNCSICSKRFRDIKMCKTHISKCIQLHKKT